MTNESSVGRSGDDVVAIRSALGQLTFADLEADLFRFRSQVPNGGRAILSTDDAGVVAAALSSLDGWAREVRLVPPGSAPPGIPGDAVVLQPGEQRDGSTVDDRCVETQWVLYTSGTTGQPKEIAHTLDSLTRTVVVGRGPALTWGLLYDPNRMAGVQVLLQALLSRSTLVAPSHNDRLRDRLDEFIEWDVNAVSATPSLWRQVLQLRVSERWSPEQVTLGGEIADQGLLDALASAFPSARIVHVFASTETSAAFSVRDGREGFPLDYLTEPPRGIRLEIRDGILHVHSPGASAAGDDGFASTGDVVEVVDDRVLFRGRASSVINVGGANVWPEHVESILRDHPDVVEAVVAAKANPMAGNVLVASVSLLGTADREGVNKRLRSWVRDRAPRSHVPASVSVVDRVDVAPSGKIVR